MDHVFVGRTGIRVSQLCFGTMTFGGEADRDASAALYRRCRDAGIDFFDKVVVPFVEHLRAEGQVPASREALDRARRTLRVEKGQQLEAEMNRLAGTLQVRR